MTAGERESVAEYLNIMCMRNDWDSVLLQYLLCFAGHSLAECVGAVVVPLKATVQVLGLEVFGPQLFPGSAAAALRVHTVPTALLIT